MTTYFFDECVSPKIAVMLRALGVDDEVVHIKDVGEGFALGDKDVDWMPRSPNDAGSW